MGEIDLVKAYKLTGKNKNFSEFVHLYSTEITINNTVLTTWKLLSE